MFCVSNEEPKRERSRFTPLKMTFWEVFLLCMASTCSSSWPLHYSTRSLSALVKNPASSLPGLPSRFPISPVGPPTKSLSKLNIAWRKLCINDWTSNLFKMTHSFGRERVLRNFWAQLLTRVEILVHCHLRYTVSERKNRSTRSFRWLGELLHDAFPSYWLQTCLLLGLG